MSVGLDALLREIRDRLAAEADPNRATFGEGYHATAMRIRGVRTPELRSIAGDLAGSCGRSRTRPSSGPRGSSRAAGTTSGRSPTSCCRATAPRSPRCMRTRSRRWARASTTGARSTRTARWSRARHGSPGSSATRSSTTGRRRPTAGGVAPHSSRPAVSWALRALSERDPDAVRTFLDAHEDALAARVRRKVRHKLETGLKNPRRRG